MSIGSSLTLRRPWRVSGLLALLAAAIVLVALGTGWWVLKTLNRIEDNLPITSLVTERDFAVLLQDLHRLDQSLQLLQIQPSEARRSAAGLALDFARLRAHDHRSLYANPSNEDQSRLNAAMDTSLVKVQAALLEAVPVPERFQEARNALQLAIVQTKQFYDRITQISLAQLSEQAGQLASFRGSLGLLLLFISIAAAGLISLLFWQRRVLQRWVQAETRLQHLAHHDPLTGLPNRALFQERLSQASAQAGQDGRLYALLYLDLDFFKDINDSLGHHAGDCLLREVGRRLQSCVRTADTVARLGGDEFAVILTHLRAPRDAAQVASSIVEAVARPVSFQGESIRTSTSVGITVFPRDGDTPEQLLVNADMALYEAKAQGRNRYGFFSQDSKTRMRARVALEEELRRALEQGELVLYYQPQVDLVSGALTGLEALLRWQHPRRGLIPPAEFLPVAEASGLIVAMGEQVLAQVCAQLRAWLDAGLNPPPVAVNLATAQFKQGHLVEAIQRTLAQTGVDPRYLEVEITEGTILDRNSGEIQRTLERIHRELTAA